VLALRGDDPAAFERFTPPAQQLAHASDLVTLVKRSGYRFGVGAACSAEKHPESPTVEHEMRYLRLKVDCGVDFLITQLFFDNAFYFDFVRRAREAGIGVPIVPGLMPIPSRRSLSVMTAMSGATVPVALQAEIDRAADDEAIRAIGVRHCIEQCAELLESGVPGLHFYTFNRARAPIQILDALRGQQMLAS
jgi:methylenetetrahydrofolate reductase (NADPH)